MKTETQRVTISSYGRKVRAMRMRELMFRGYTLAENGLHEKTTTCKRYETKQDKTYFDTDVENTRYIAIMKRVVPCKS